MGHAALVVAAVLAAAALRRIDRFVNGTDDVGHRNISHGLCQGVAATRAAHAIDNTLPAQTAEQLFQVGQGNPLPLADAG